MKFRISFLFIAFLLFNCSKDTTIKTNFSEVIQPKQNLSFVFDEKIKDLDKEPYLAQWHFSDSYLEITPKINGSFKWNSPYELVFSPEDGFRPATKYEIRIKIPGHSKKFTVRTPELKIEQVIPFYALEENQKHLAFEIHFNYAVSHKISENLKAIINGKTYSLAPAEKQSKSKKLVFFIKNSEELPAGEGIKIILEKGATCLACSEYNSKDFTYFSYVPPTSFVLQDLRTTSENGEYSLHITFSETPDPNQDFSKLIELEIPFTVQVAGSELIIKAPFEEKKYKITIHKNLKSVFGEKLGKDYHKEVAFAPEKPYLNFADTKGMYLRKEGAKNLALKIIAIPEVEVTVHKIYDVNLVHFLREKVYRSYYDDSWEISTYGLQNYGDLIYKTSYSTNKLPKIGSNYLLNLNIFDTRKNYKGIFLVNVQDPRNYWNRASKIVAISDIGITFKETTDEYLVFCHSLKDNSPISGVKINLLSRSNLSFAEASTDAEGTARIKKNEDFIPVLILAEKEGDVNFLSLNFSEVSNPDFATEGKEVKNTDIYIYGERTLYRPGEEGNFVFVLRDVDFNPIQFPVKVKITSPRGTDVLEQMVTPNSEGIGEFSYKIPLTANTGSYYIKLFKGDEFLKSKPFKVEEFTPDRLKVLIEAPKEIVGAGKEEQVKILAKNLYGTPAQFRNVNVLVEFLPKTFTNKKFKDYTFALTTPKRNIKTREFTGRTDAQGNYSFTLKIPGEWENTGLLKARIIADVNDETGHATTSAKSIDVYTQTNFIGIQKIYPFQPVGKPVKIPFVVLNHQGKLANIPFSVEVYRIIWEAYWEKNSWGDWNYKTFKKEILVHQQKITPQNGKATMKFLAPVSGSYKIKAFFKEGTYVSYVLDCWGEGAVAENSFGVSKDGTIKITLPKEKFSPGETAEVLFATPFDGKLLITLESAGKVLKYHTIDTENKTAKWNFKISEEMLPNVFIYATLLKDIHTKIPFSVARGLENILVQPEDRKIPVTISAAEKSESNTQQTIRIKTKPNVFLTVSVVDEGVLQVAREGKTDPYAYFYAPRRLSVKNYDLYSYLLPEYSENAVGGGMLQESISADELLSPHAEGKKNVSFWSGVIQADANGNAKFSIDIPDFSGKLRIRVAAIQGHSFGYAEKFMTVADNVVITLGTPSFLAPKDKVQIPLVLANTTEKSLQVSLKLKNTEKLKLYGNIPSRISLAPKEEKRIMMTFLAENTGQGTLALEISYGNKKKIIERKISIRPASQVQVISQGGVINGKGEISIGGADFLFAEKRLVVSTNPVVRFGKALDFLLEYPYGCLEQTISKAFPQLYFAELSNALQNQAGNKRKQEIAKQHIKVTLEKLSMFKTPRGGMSLWQGGYRPDLWATVFATHFLTEAKAKDFPVNENLLRDNIRFLKNRAHQVRKEPYKLPDGTSKNFVPKWLPYALFVLAKNKEAPRSLLRYCSENYGDLTPEGKYLLAATYKILGDEDNTREYLPKSINQNWTQSRYYFSSTFRDKALAAYALMIASPDNAQVPLLLNELSEKLNGTKYFSTQEAVFSLLAVAQFRPEESATQVTLQTSKGKISLKKNETRVLRGEDLQNVLVQSDGYVYYYWSLKGIPENPADYEQDNGLKVRRKYYSVNGNPLGSPFKKGETIVVKLTVENHSGEFIENGVVSDLLPAGFEIQNPRLLETLSLNNFERPSHFVYRDIREDRINFFTSLPVNGRKVFYYIVRAVRSGEFQQGTAMALDMYKPSINSYQGSGKVRVKGKEIF